MSDEFDPYYTWLGIPPEDQPPDFYRLLGLQRFETNVDVISHAADQRMSHIRTFQTGNRSSYTQPILNELSRARRCLLKPEKKQQYDQELLQAEPVDVVPPHLREATPPPVPAGQAMPVGGESAGVDESPAAGIPVIEAGPSTVARNRRRRATKPRNGKPWGLIAGLGAVLVVLVVLIVIVQGRSDAGDTAAEDGNGDPTGETDRDRVTPEDDPDEPDEPDENEDDPPVTVVDANPDEEDPGEMDPDGDAGTGGQPHALMFAGNHHVLIGRSQPLVSMERSFTVEAWIRLPTTRVMYGEFLGTWRRLSSDNERGWALGLQRTVRQREPQLALRLSGSSRAGSVPLGTFPLDGEWHHVALVKTVGEEYAVYLDGNRLAQARWNHGSDAEAGDLFLGSYPGLRPFIGEFKGLRVSSSARYDGERFDVPETLGRDPQTTLLLDFAQPQPRQIADVGPQRLSGTLTGARWSDTPVPDTGPTVTPPESSTVDVLERAISTSGAVAVRGNPIVSGGAIVTQEGSPDLMMLPYSPPDSYVLEADVTRIEGDGGLVLGIIVAGRPTSVSFDTFRAQGPYTGMTIIDNVRLAFGGYRGQRHRGVVLVQNRRVRLRVRVRPEEIVVEAGDQELMRWTGDGVLGFDRMYRVPDPSRLFLAAFDSQFRIDRFVVSPWEPAPSDVVVSPVPPGPASEERLSPPSQEDRDTMRTAVRRELEDQFDAVRAQPLLQIALGRELLALARDPAETDAVRRYVLLEEAATLAQGASDFDLLFEIVDVLAQHFDIDPFHEKLRWLETARITIPEARMRRLMTALKLAVSALDAGAYEQADAIADATAGWAARVRDVALRQRARELRERVEREYERWEAAEEAAVVLAEDPTDADAAALRGKFLALVSQSWSEGGPLLQQSDDRQLRLAGELESKASRTVQEEHQLGDLWWELAGAAEPYRFEMRQRARFWYERVVPRVAPVERTTLMARINEVTQEETARAALVGPRRVLGMGGEITVDGQKLPITFRYVPGETITAAAILDDLRRLGIASPTRVTLELKGTLELPQAANVQVQHAGGSDNGGAVRLQVGSTVYADGSVGRVESTRNLSLTAGKHEFSWTVSGGDIGACLLQVGDQRGRPLPLYHEE